MFWRIWDDGCYGYYGASLRPGDGVVLNTPARRDRRADVVFGVSGVCGCVWTIRLVDNVVALVLGCVGWLPGEAGLASS